MTHSGLRQNVGSSKSSLFRGWSLANTVLRSDPRFAIASRTHNARFPAEPEQLPGRVSYCVDAEDVARTLQQVINAGLRPTVRSSGHCYEDFIVNNPSGAILDVSLMNRVGAGQGSGAFHLEPGVMLGRAYEDLYKLAGVCIPGGTCYTVTAGGHISGGGYGTLVRQYGLTVDWLTAVDIVTIDARGNAIARRANKQQHPDLFRALRGGQGSNFGVITAFHFAELPPMPQEVVKAGLTWDWSGLGEDDFVRILQTYGNWMVRNSSNKDSWGLFAALQLNNEESGKISLRAEYIVPTGPVKDTSVLTDFLDQFAICAPRAMQWITSRNSYLASSPRAAESVLHAKAPAVSKTDIPVSRQSWLEAMVGGQSGSAIQFADRNRAKYKSCYMKQNFTDEEARTFYRMFTSDRTRGLIVAVDSYGGAVNSVERAADTAIPQRASVMKLQYMSFWKRQEEDGYRLHGIREAYQQIYSTAEVSQRYKGAPYPGDHYEGCYINYPDVDMLQYPFWHELYYGTGSLYGFLQDVKRKYDPHNIFHHSMSIRV